VLPAPPVRRRIRLSRLLANALLATASVILALGASELLLRGLVPPARHYSALPPGATWTLIPEPKVLHGLDGVSHVHVNRFGVRGRTFGDDRVEYRILAVGGSTTLCRALDDTEVWTHLLEVDLGRTLDERQVWVGNIGRDGASARDHVLQLKYLLRQYPRMDVVVALVGVNDMMPTLHQGWHYRLPAAVTEPDAERDEMSRAFALFPGRLPSRFGSGAGPLPWYKTTALWQLGRRAKEVVARRRPIRMGIAGQSPLEDARHAREAATKIDSLPSLDAPMTEYRRNLNAMADLSAAAGVRLVFVTQPSAWREALSPWEEHQLWLGLIEADGASAPAYFTTRALSRAMARYNAVLLQVCHQRNLDCLDAANLLPHDTAAMYDDVHFNEQGSRSLARVLAEHFRARPPFRRPT
jgi:lysophospholipase L1-like esterase